MKLRLSSENKLEELSRDSKLGKYMNYKLQVKSETWNKHVIKVKDACTLKHKSKVQMLSKESEVISTDDYRIMLT